MRSRASGVARLETVAGPFILNSRLRVRFVDALYSVQTMPGVKEDQG